ncbi:MAG: hypothetical protein E7480_00485 [Ruminococcaceae bacterium]|nr:hypothetical protein [Oscillospiraceae bacterium]
MHNKFKTKALSVLTALLLLSSVFTLLLPSSVIVAEEEQQPIRPGMFEVFKSENYITGQTGLGGKFSNIDHFVSMSMFFGSYIKQIDVNYWASSSRATVPYGIRAIDGNQSITYPVRDNTYFAFNTITGTNYKIGSLTNLIYNTEGTGWHLQVSYDNGKNFENINYDNIYQAQAYNWTDANKSPTKDNSFNILDYLATYSSEPDYKIPVPDCDKYCLVTHVYKIPAFVTHVRIMFPKYTAIEQYDSVTNQQYAGLWSQSLSSIKLSRTKIDSTSKGDTAVKNYYEDPCYSVKSSQKESFVFSKDILYINDEIVTDFSLSNIEKAFDTTMSKVQFYDSSDNLITNYSTLIDETMKVKFVAHGYTGTVAGLVAGDVINEYTVKISELKEPEFVLKDNLAHIEITDNNIVIKQKSDEEDITYEDFKNYYNISYGDILFYEMDGTPITDLDAIVSPQCIAKFVTKDCPGQVDGVVKSTCNLSLVLDPIYIDFPETETDSKLILKPGIADRFIPVVNPTTGVSFSSYATFENGAALSLVNIGPDTLAWFDTQKVVFGKEATGMVHYNAVAPWDIEPALVYKVQPETYVGAVFIVGSNLTTAKDALDSIEDVQFLASKDGDIWVDLGDPYKGCISTTNNLYLGDIKRALKASYDDGKGNNHFSGWSQVLFSSYIPEGYTYFKIKMPNNLLQRELIGSYRFKDAANGDYSLDDSVLYTWCSIHGAWCSPTHEFLNSGEGAIVATNDGVVFQYGFNLALVKASSTPITCTPEGDLVAGDPEYSNNYDASEFIIKDNKISVLGDILNVRNFGDEKTTYQEILDRIELRFAQAKFYTDDTLSVEITDLSKPAENTAYLCITAHKNKVIQYYPEGKVLGLFKVSPVKVTDVPSVVENGNLYTIDHEQKTITFFYYMDESAPTYATVKNTLKGKEAQFRFETLAGEYVDINLDGTSNYANVLICAYNCEGFNNGDVFTKYTLLFEPVLKDVSVSSLDESKVEIDNIDNVLVIHSDSFTIGDIDKLLKKNNCTVMFSMLQADGSFETILDYSTLANTDVYVDLFSTVDSRTYSYPLTFDVPQNEEDTIKVLNVPELETLSIDDFSAVVSLITEYNKYYYQYDENQRAYYENAINLLKTKMDNLFVAQQIAELTAGLPTTLTSANINTVLLIEKSYASLFSEVRDTLDSSITDQIANFKEQVGAIIQSDNGVKVSGLKWNIRIKVKGLSTKDEAFARVNPKVSGTNLLSLFEIEFYDILNNQKFALEEDKVITISLPVKDFEGYENLLGLYERTDGKVSYLQSTLEGDYISFKVKPFNSVGVVGSEPFPVLIVVLASIGGLIVLAGIAVGVIFFVKNKNKVKGGTEE